MGRRPPAEQYGGLDESLAAAGNGWNAAGQRG
jgi:hypothetical protein